MKEARSLLCRLLEESGAAAFGAAEAAPVPDEEWARFEDWIARGWHAGMGYMENYPEIRRDPRLLLPGATTIISIAYNYRQPNPYRGVATYAIGRDYHKVLRKRLKKVVGTMKTEFGGEWRICIDSAPILERYWAQRCGVGVRSPLHGNIVVPGTGSMVFLAEILTTLPIPSFTSRRGDNIPPEPTAAASPCPTGALQEGGTVDARRCINYLTIEHRGGLTEEETAWVGEAVFGCDICLRACPANRGEAPEVLPEFRPMKGLKEFLEGTPGEFDISKSPLKRAHRLRK